MTEPNNQSLTDNKNEEIIDSLTSEITSLKIQLMKKDDRISSLDAMLNTLMKSHSAETRAYEDLRKGLCFIYPRMHRLDPRLSLIKFWKRVTLRTRKGVEKKFLKTLRPYNDTGQLKSSWPPAKQGKL
jgi:predicted RNase H-like nuclease (RuvC/YqgF family)